jgi:hypothetical protein
VDGIAQTELNALFISCGGNQAFSDRIGGE